MFSLFCSSCSIEFDHSAVERLGRSEIVRNLIAVFILQRPEPGELVGRDLERGQEVDPVDDLVTARSGQGPVVGAVGGGGGDPDRSNPEQQVRHFEGRILHGNFGGVITNIDQLLNQWSQGIVGLRL